MSFKNWKQIWCTYLQLKVSTWYFMALWMLWIFFLGIIKFQIFFHEAFMTRNFCWTTIFHYIFPFGHIHTHLTTLQVKHWLTCRTMILMWNKYLWNITKQYLTSFTIIKDIFYNVAYINQVCYFHQKCFKHSQHLKLIIDFKTIKRRKSNYEQGA
jgi:hypothetical protein